MYTNENISCDIESYFFLYSFCLPLLLKRVWFSDNRSFETNYFETLTRVHMSIVQDHCKIDPLRRVQTSIETNIPSL